VKIPGLLAPVPEKVTRSVPVKADVSGAVKTADARPVSASKTPNQQVDRLPVGKLSSSLQGNLPSDRLASSIISFARFLSLPLDPQMLVKARRQALSAGQPAQAPPEKPTETPLFLKSREDRALTSLALASLAAASKGVELSGEGLKEYASALNVVPIDPDRQEGQRQNKRNNSGDSKKQKGQNPEIAAITSAGIPELKAQILRAAEQNPLLELLNRLPAKNGQRWLVFPFALTDQGEDYRLCLKILLNQAENQRPLGQMAGYLALEIEKIGFAGENGPNRRWLFVINAENNKNLRLRVFIDPFVSKKNHKSLISELSQSLEIAPEYINIQNFAEFFPFEENTQSNVLLSVDEEV
jgi:hypothetical protein